MNAVFFPVLMIKKRRVDMLVLGLWISKKFLLLFNCDRAVWKIDSLSRVGVYSASRAEDCYNVARGGDDLDR